MIHSTMQRIANKGVSLMAQQKMKTAQKMESLLNDGELHVFTVGTGSPLPGDRAQACTCVIAGENFVVFDCGAGSFARCREMGLPVGKITAMVITHFHSDHIGELGEYASMSWATGGRKTPLDVYGPPGIVDVVEGFGRAYQFDCIYRNEHHTSEYLPMEGSKMRAHEVALPGGKNGAMGLTKVFHNDGLKIQAFNVDHKPVEPAYGYIIEYQGRKVVISGDTCECETLEKYSQGIDMLITESCACHLVDTIAQTASCCGEKRNSHILNDIKDYHFDNQALVEMGKRLQTPVLTMTHLVPAPPDNRIARWLWNSNIDLTGFSGRLVVAEDGMSFSLPPAPSTEVRQKNYLEKKSLLPKLVAFLLFFLLIDKFLLQNQYC